LGKLFEPIKIGTIELKNSVVMPTMGTNFSTENGYAMHVCACNRSLDYFSSSVSEVSGMIRYLRCGVVLLFT
jgi:hypothetical protein